MLFYDIINMVISLKRVYIILLLFCILLLTGCGKSACNSTEEDVKEFLEKYSIQDYTIEDYRNEFVGYSTKNHHLRVWNIQSNEFDGYTFHVYETADGSEVYTCDGLESDYIEVRGEAFLEKNCPKEIDCSHWQAVSRFFRSLDQVEDVKRLDYISTILFSSEKFEKEISNIYDYYQLDIKDKVDSIMIEDSQSAKNYTITVDSIQDLSKEEFIEKINQFFQE